MIDILMFSGHYHPTKMPLDRESCEFLGPNDAPWKKAQVCKTCKLKHIFEKKTQQESKHKSSNKIQSERYRCSNSLPSQDTLVDEIKESNPKSFFCISTHYPWRVNASFVE